MFDLTLVLVNHLKTEGECSKKQQISKLNNITQVERQKTPKTMEIFD
jgi:hypothetical protein